jgi:hypothetical protein
MSKSANSPQGGYVRIFPTNPTISSHLFHKHRFIVVGFFQKPDHLPKNPTSNPTKKKRRIDLLVKLGRLGR